MRAWGLMLFVAGCSGAIGGGQTGPDAGPSADASDVITHDGSIAPADDAAIATSSDATTGGRPDAMVLVLGDGGLCATAAAAAEFFQSEGCLNCHGGVVAPSLRLANLPNLASAPSNYRPGHTVVVPGRPTESELFLRLAGPQPADYAGSWWMPVGSGRAHRDPGAVERWITANAEISCDVGVVPPVQTQTITNPNHYDQAQLFTCRDPSAPRSSPPRIRRIEAREYSLASGTSVGGRFSDAIVTSNPLVTPQKSYATARDDLTLDGTTLELLLTTLSAAANLWVTRAQGPSSGGRYWTVFDGTPSGFYTSANPTSADRDIWVDLLLRQGALFRAPTADETLRVRQLLDAEIAAEGTPFTNQIRSESLRTVASAARLMVGAMFRSELGSTPASRSLLAPEELGLALGSVIGAHPVSSTLWGELPAGADTSSSADWSRPVRTDGRLAEVRDAVNDGTITQKTTIAALLARYRGGVDPFRIDLTTEYHRANDHDAVLRQRGEYWLSDGLTEFFRQWLEVAPATTMFKDTPNATSHWVRPRSNVESTGFGALQPSLVTLLDDTIARAVIEAERSGGDVFRALLTTRTFRLMTNVDGLDTTRPCATPADCGDFREGICYVSAGFCAAFGSTERNRAFNVATDVPDTHDARWVTLPANERSGVLTHPTFLVAHGGNFEDDASLVHRGKWIRESLLCTDVPGLELVSVPALLEPRSAALRARDRVKNATEGAGSACLTCHAQMNPYGYAFELYNHAGFLRADDHGQTPDGRTTITNAPDPTLNRSYASPMELTDALAASPYARRCFVRNVFRWFMGRAERPEDACTLSDMEAAFAGGSLFAMLEALTTSDTFLYRSPR